MSKVEPKSPLTIIAIFAGIIEASALASLPFLSEDSQTTYTWFLVGFPFFLTVLFFLTLNFNYKSLYSPAETESLPLVAADTSLPPSQLLPASTEEITQVSEEIRVCNKTSDTPAGVRNAPVQALGNPSQNSQATVSITLSGASAGKLQEHFALQALNQPSPLCHTWILNNLETGTQTTLSTKPLDK
ncbi:hypothetical protein [Pseudomonas sp. UM16]|uniref:hypothetical protein n=1 Tax=Pseudomonas sp. UM16 TaxID=3158962 RepID=UPI0039901BCF